MRDRPDPLSMDRRTFLGTGAAALASGLVFRSNAKGAVPKGAPNIIFIHVDQMSLLDSIGACGAEYASTPNIDRLVRKGTSFMQSYAADPICCPAWTSWWTGCYSSEHGVVMNGVPCHADTPGISSPPFSAWFYSAPTAPTYSPRPLDALRACLGRTLPAAAVWW